MEVWMQLTTGDTSWLTSYGFKWFTLMYPVLGGLFVATGLWCAAAEQKAELYLLDRLQLEHPPVAWLQSLRALMLIFAVSLVMGAFMRTWIEILFSVWGLALLFILARLLAGWQSLRLSIQHRSTMEPLGLRNRIRLAGLQLIVLGIVMFLLLSVLLPENA